MNCTCDTFPTWPDALGESWTCPTCQRKYTSSESQWGLGWRAVDFPHFWTTTEPWSSETSAIWPGVAT